MLYCTPALLAPLQQIAARFTAHSQVRVHLFVASPDGLLGLIRHRARDDLVVADAATLTLLADRHLVRADSLVALGTDPFVLIARRDANLRTGETASGLAASHPIVLPDPTTAASFDGAAILRAALPALPNPPTIGVADTPTVIARVRQDPGVIGLVNRSEADGPGIEAEADLAAPPTPIEAGLVTAGQSADAPALLAFLAGPSGQAILRAAGLRPSQSGSPR